MSDHDSSQHYKQARQMGKKYQSDNSGNAYNGYLLVLDDLIKDVEIVSELNLGTREIPIEKIIGTRTSARSNAFAGNFMPLLAENTEFGAKWKKLYNSHIDEGIREPIKVYEYINRYFALEGNKRISVLKYCGAASAYAKVTRIIPKRDESNSLVTRYYEFLDFDKRASFNNLWFSHTGSFTRLVQIVEKYKTKHPEVTDSIEELINSAFKTFRLSYKSCGFGSIPITSGDAFLEFTEIYGFHPNTPVSGINDRVKSCEAQFKLLSLKDTNDTNTVEMKQDNEKSPLSFFSKRPSKLKIAFAFEGDPEHSLWTHTHYVAMQRLQKKMGDKVDIISKSGIYEKGSYKAICELMEQEPDILFTTSPNMSSASLRLSLENPDKTILNCDIAQPQKNMMTYFAKQQEAVFLCGVVAGAMTKSNIVGYMTSARFHKDLTFNVNAFALGAQLVNPHVKVVNFIQSHTDYEPREHIAARRKLAQAGVDIALCLHQLNTPLVRKAFPGVYAQVFKLERSTGYPEESLGAIALDWSVFYDQIVGDSFTTKNSILDITRSGYDSAVHFGWGMNTGIIDVYGVDAFMGHNAVKLLKIFRSLIVSGQIHPFEGPMTDRDGVLRVEKDDVPSLIEIQNMDWMLDTITEVIEG